MIDSKYEWRKGPQADRDRIEELAASLDVSELTASVLVSRGYDTVEKAGEFLNPGPDDLNAPVLMHDMEKGVERIREAIVSGSRITVYGDYDADGLTSTAIMYETLQQLGADCDYYIPNRFADGYGPNRDVYERLIGQGTGLIVTVDNGVAGSEAVAYAREKGVDVVITDHHELPKELPDAYAVIHPRIPTEKGEYPFGGLSGAGVAFKVATALLNEVPEEMLDLCAIGTVADLVPLTGENRVLVKYGLKALQNTERLGLLSLYQECSVSQEKIDEETIGFSIAPHLNALGRMADANAGVELLTTMDDERAAELAKKVRRLNVERQKLVNDITAQAQALLKEDSAGHCVNLVWGEGWHEGVLGIVASRLVESTGRPSIVLGVNCETNTAKGSGRSVEAFNLFDALDGHRDMMEKFGGHHMACGLTVSADELPKLQEILDAEAERQNLSEASKPVLSLDGDIDISMVSPEMIQELGVIGPFGTDNPKPVFSFHGFTVGEAKAMGDGSHLRLNLVGDDGKTSVSAVRFGIGDRIDEILADSAGISFVGSLSINSWQGNEYPQIRIEDLEKKGMSIEVMRTRRLKKSMFFDEKSVYVFFTHEWYRELRQYIPQGALVVLAGRDMEQITAGRVVLVDCPVNTAQLTHALGHIRTGCLRLIFFQNDDCYKRGMPSRTDFAKVYGKVRDMKEYPIVKNLGAAGQYLEIAEPDLVFILKVFLEAKFVKIEDGCLTGLQQVERCNLKDTREYRMHQKYLEVERLLLDGSDDDLKSWMLQNVQ